MKWQAQGEYLVISNTIPAYKVCKVFIGAEAEYRPSFSGEFISLFVPTFDEAKAICERHHQITGEAQEAA